MTKMLSKIDAKINIEKGGFRGRPGTKNASELVARRVGKGGGKPPSGGLGSLEERKKRRKEERKKGRKEDVKV